MAKKSADSEFGFEEDTAQWNPRNSDTKRSPKDSFIYELFTSKKQVALGMLAAIILGLLAAILMPSQVRTSVKINLAFSVDYLNLADILRKLTLVTPVPVSARATNPNAGGLGSALINSVLDQHIFDQETIEILYAKKPELFANLDYENPEKFYKGRFKIKYNLPVVEGRFPQSNKIPAYYSLDIMTQSRRTGRALMDGYIETLKEQLQKKLLARIKSMIDSKKLILQASFDAEKQTRLEVAKIQIESLQNDISLARLAGFENPAFQLKTIQTTELPLQSAVPRYFFGYKILEEELNILERVTKDDRRLKNYLPLINLENISKTQLKVLGNSNFSIVKHEYKRTVRTARLFVRLLVGAIVTWLVMFFLLALKYGAFWNRKFANL